MKKELFSEKQKVEEIMAKMNSIKEEKDKTLSEMDKMQDTHKVKAEQFKMELAKLSGMMSEYITENDNLKKQIEILSDSTETDEKMRLIEKEFKEQLSMNRFESDHLKT